LSKNSSNLRNLFIVLVEPKFSENLGSILRVMKNFGITNLVLIRPKFDIDERVFVSSVWAGDILFKAIVLEELSQAKKLCDVLIATSARISKTKSLRKYLSLKSKDKFNFIFGCSTGIVFGCEDTGLTNEELRECEFLIHIPTSRDYPVLNLSHAVAIVCYELFAMSNKIQDFDKLATPREKKVFTNAILNNLNLSPKDKVFLERILMRTPVYRNEIKKALGIIKRKRNK